MEPELEITPEPSEEEEEAIRRAVERVTAREAAPRSAAWWRAGLPGEGSEESAAEG